MEVCKRYDSMSDDEETLYRGFPDIETSVSRL